MSIICLSRAVAFARSSASGLHGLVPGIMTQQAVMPIFDFSSAARVALASSRLRSLNGISTPSNPNPATLGIKSSWSFVNAAV